MILSVDNVPESKRSAVWQILSDAQDAINSIKRTRLNAELADKSA